MAATFDGCMREMFRRVGARYSEGFCRRDDWYRERSWTQGQEKEFREWMVAWVRRRHRWTKEMAEREATWFLFQYGWKNSPNGCLAVGRGWRCK